MAVPNTVGCHCNCFDLAQVCLFTSYIHQGSSRQAPETALTGLSLREFPECYQASAGITKNLQLPDLEYEWEQREARATFSHTREPSW